MVIKYIKIFTIIIISTLQYMNSVYAIGEGNELTTRKQISGYGSIIWRPGEPTKARLSKAYEYRPYYMEEMTVCNDPELKKMEKSKWSWCYPMETDLYVFAELIGGITKEKLNEILLKNNYFNIGINTPAMKKREQTIRQIFKKIDKTFIFTTIKENELYEKAWMLAEKHIGHYVVVASYWRGIGGKYNGYYGSIEFCINYDKKEYSVVDDYWDANRNGWCMPDLKGRWMSISNLKPWDGNPFNYLIFDIYRGFFPKE